MDKQIKSSIGISIVVILAIIAGTFMWIKSKEAGVIDSVNINAGNLKKSKPEQRFCTQEAKQCADGSYVSRTGPNCEFAECPNSDALSDVERNINRSANPASINCAQKGGILEIRVDSNGEQIGYCKFSNGLECEEWAFFREKCKSGNTNVDISDWQTYKNDEYGFEFKYPSFLTTINFQNMPYIISLHDKSNVYGGVDVWMKNVKFDINNIKGYDGELMDSKYIRKLNIDNINAYEYEIGDGGAHAIVVNFPLGNKTLMVSFADSEGQKQLDEYKNRILSTFKFTK